MVLQAGQFWQLVGGIVPPQLAPVPTLLLAELVFAAGFGTSVSPSRPADGKQGGDGDGRHVVRAAAPSPCSFTGR